MGKLSCFVGGVMGLFVYLLRKKEIEVGVAMVYELIYERERETVRGHCFIVCLSLLFLLHSLPCLVH